MTLSTIIESSEQTRRPPPFVERHDSTLGSYSGQMLLAQSVQNLEETRNERARSTPKRPDLRRVVTAFKRLGDHNADVLRSLESLQSLWPPQSLWSPPQPPHPRLHERGDLNEGALQLLSPLPHDARRLFERVQELRSPETILWIDSKSRHALREMAKAATQNDMHQFLSAKDDIDWVDMKRSDFRRVIDLALKIGAFAVAREVSRLAAIKFSNDPELTEYSRILSVPRVIKSDVPSKSDLKPNKEWLRDNRSEYLGRWVALRDGQLIESADTLEEFVTKVDRKATGALLTRVQ